MKKVITYGTYDLLHQGHINLLKRAKNLGDYLIVGVTSDDYDKTRGKINNQESLMERIENVKNTGIADEIIIEEYEGQKIDDIKRFDIDIFTVGSDWQGKFDYLNEFCEVVYLERTKGISSSEIRSDKRKLSIGIVGNLELIEKFKREIKFVNGAELKDYGKNYSGVDAIYIADLPKNHYEHIKNALLNNKHVICESPITISKKQYDELTKIANDRNLILADAIKTAYSTAYSRMLVLAKSGKIGDVVSVDASCTSLRDIQNNNNLNNIQNSICNWGPVALLPIFQLLGTKYKNKTIVTHIEDDSIMFDGYTKIDFIYENAVASAKIAQCAKAESELIITGTKGYIYVPAPWWKTDYFEVRYENPADNRRYFYQLDGEGIRYEIAAFVKAIQVKKSNNPYVDESVSEAIIETVEDFYNKKFIEI